MRAVILDELHAMIDTKRGAHLMLSIARLEKLSGRKLQRIGLSATIEPVSYTHLLEKAEEILREDYITYGVMMVKEKIADGLVAGACHATADTLRPALQILKTAPGTELVSGFFIMDVPDCEFGNNGTFLFADCGLNQDPTAEELAAIADSSAKSYRALVGEKPVIAMLSHSTKGSAHHTLVDKVVKMCIRDRHQPPGLY